MKRFEFNFYDAHVLNTARDSSQEQTIKRRLRGAPEQRKGGCVVDR